MKLDLNLTDILNLPVKIMSALTLASGFLLLLPKRFLAKLYLTPFIDKYGFIIGLVFIISLAILLVTLVIQIFNHLSDKKNKKWFYDTASERLMKLSPYEKSIVLILYENANYTHLLPVHDGAVKKIKADFIISEAATQYAVADLNNAKFPYFLQPWVVNELQKNNELLKNFENTANEFANNKDNKEIIYNSFFRDPNSFY